MPTYPNIKTLPPFIGIILALACLSYTLADQQTDFSTFSGFRIENSTKLAKLNGEAIHCHDIANSLPVIETANRRGSQKRILWLGASQLHTITNYRPNDEVAPSILAEKLSTKKIDLSVVSSANANFMELLTIYNYMKSKIKFQTLLIGAVYDDMKELGIRESIQIGLTLPAVETAMRKSSAGRKICDTYVTLELSNANLAVQEQGTLQNDVESWLTERLEKNSKLWALRYEAQGWVQIGTRYIRDYLISIATGRSIENESFVPSQVTIPRAAYNDNYAAFTALLETARKDGVQVIVYLAPRPMDAYFPYEMAPYTKFQQDIKSSCKEYGAAYYNLESAIPNKDWGQTGEFAEKPMRDIFHCKGSGHYPFADAIFETIVAEGK